MVELKFPYKPYPWQVDALDKLASFEDTILTVPPGSGKESVVAMTAVKWVLYGGKVVWLTAKSGSGEWNKRKELKKIIKKNNLKLMVVMLRAKQGLCPYARDWAKKHRQKVKDDVMFCRVAREAKEEPCPYRWDIRKEIKMAGIVDEKAAPKGYCPYYWLRAAQKNADITIADYNYAISPMVRGVIVKANPGFIDYKTLVIFDEAHLLTPRAQGVFRTTLSLTTVDRAIAELHGRFLHRAKIDGKGEVEVRFKNLIRRNSMVEGYLRRIKKRMEKLYEKKKKEMSVEFEEKSGEEKAEITKKDFLTESIRDARGPLKQLGRAIARFKYLYGIGVESQILTIGEFIDRFARLAGSKWVCPFIAARTREIEKKHEKSCRIGLALLNPYNMLKYPLQESCWRLFYSGTLYPEPFKRIYRLPEGIRVLDYPPPFPPETRLDVLTGKYRIGRDWLEEEKNAERLARDVAKWTRKISPVAKCFAVMTTSQAKKIEPHLEKMGIECNIVPSVPRKKRKSTLNRILRKEDLVVRVLRPHGWESHCLDIKNINAILMVGVPISRVTVEKRAMVRYFAKTFRKEGKEIPAFVWLMVVPAIQRHIQTNARARIMTPKERVATTWLDERYLGRRYNGYVKEIGKRKNYTITKSLAKTINETTKYLKNPQDFHLPSLRR